MQSVHLESGNMFNAKTISNFISKNEAEEIVNIVKTIEPWDNPEEGFWQNRVLNVGTIYTNHSKELAMLIYNIKLKIEDAITELYGGKKVFADLLQVVRWFPGMEQTPHADDMTDSDAEGLDWFHHRHFGAILYLNDDYKGGHTYYPQHNKEIIPEIGKLAVHPGSPDHMHGVSKIEDGVRYTIASFWTYNKAYNNDWSLYK